MGVKRLSWSLEIGVSYVWLHVSEECFVSTYECDTVEIMTPKRQRINTFTSAEIIVFLCVALVIAVLVRPTVGQ